MKLGKLIEDLCQLELQNLSMVDKEDKSTVRVEDRAKIMSAINDGLFLFSSVFPLRTREVLLKIIEGKSIYPIKQANVSLDGEFSYSKYLFNGDADDVEVVKITDVYTDKGKIIPLNDMNNIWSVFTSSFDTLQIPMLLDSEYISVMYQSVLPTLSYADTEKDINLPPLAITALRSYVASKIYSSLNGEENSRKSAELIALFGSLMEKIELLDLTSASRVVTNVKLTERGFV